MKPAMKPRMICATRIWSACIVALAFVCGSLPVGAQDYPSDPDHGSIGHGGDQ